MLFSSFSTRSMVFAYFAKAQLPFSLFRDLFNDTAEFTLCYGLHDCSHLFQGYFIHSLSTLYYYNAPSLTTRLTGDYRDRTYTGKCSPALLDTHTKCRRRGLPLPPANYSLLYFLQSISFCFFALFICQVFIQCSLGFSKHIIKTNRFQLGLDLRKYIVKSNASSHKSVFIFIFKVRICS